MDHVYFATEFGVLALADDTELVGFALDLGFLALA